MSMWVDDLVGMNAALLSDMPLVNEPEEIEHVLAQGKPVSIAGMRHSQGGHTVVTQGRMALTTAGLNRIGMPKLLSSPQPWTALVEVEAGATWSQLHRVLGPMGLAPMVQQSSAGFTIGGSLSVNCHGRDPRWGPVCDSVEDVTVMTAAQGLLQASRTQHADLFWAVLGGYGACGMIVKATLRVIDNRRLLYVGHEGTKTLHQYVQHAHALVQAHDNQMHLHYAWLCCVKGWEFYRQVLITDFEDVGNPVPSVDPRPHRLDEFFEQAWGEDELLRSGWASARVSPWAFRSAVWQRLMQRHCEEGYGGKGEIKTRIDWLRAPTSFTGYRGNKDADILQEFFVPLDALPSMIDFLKKLFQDFEVFNVLSTTLRVVRPDPGTLLSYCAQGPMACIAVDMAVPIVRDVHGHAHLAPTAIKGLSSAIDEALALQGTYYLPYYKVASAEQFLRAYPRAQSLQNAIDKYNPVQGDGTHRFWNHFLAHCFH